MKRPPPCAAAWLGAALLCSPLAVHPQARGPSAKEVRENGQDVGSGYKPRMQPELAWGWKEVPVGEPLLSPEVAALGRPGELDAATSQARILELEAWLRRMPGRYRIGGFVETPGKATVEVIGADNFMSSLEVHTTLQGKVTGAADCAVVGQGVGVNCIINASWPIIDVDVAAVAVQQIGAPPIAPPSLSEALNTLTPAVLNLGMNIDPPGIRAQLVTADSWAHAWAGKLAEDTLTADRLTPCMQPIVSERPSQPNDEFKESICLQPLEIIAEPGSDVVTIILRSRPPWYPAWKPRPQYPKERLTITLTMQRESAASAEKPLQRKKVR